MNSKVIKSFIKLDVLAVLFGVLFFTSQYLLGLPITIFQSVIAVVTFWVLSLITSGLMGQLKAN